MERYAWLVLIAGTCLEGAMWWSRSKEEREHNPEVARGYRSLIFGWLVYGNLLWVLMGTGILFGGLPDIFAYFDLRNGPFVVAWYATLVVLWLALIYWIFFREGAETLVRHPGFFRSFVRDVLAIKVVVLLMLAGGAAGLALVVANTFG